MKKAIDTNKLLEESVGYLKKGRYDWAHPFITTLEGLEPHRAMYWAIEVIKMYINDSGDNMDRIKVWLGWIKVLEEIVDGIKKYSLEDINKMCQDIFHYLSARTNCQVIISQVYAAEGAFILGRTDSYIKKMNHFMAHLNDLEFELNPIAIKAIKLFDDFT